MVRRLSSWIAPLLVMLPLLACEGGKEMEVSAVSPKTGHLAGDQTVQIQGKNFRTDIGYAVYFGQARAKSVTIGGGDSLVVTTPAGSQGTVDVTVRVDDGRSFVLKQGFRYEDMGGSVVEGLGESAAPKNKGNLAY